MGRIREFWRTLWTPREKKSHEKALDRWENEGGQPADETDEDHD